MRLRGTIIILLSEIQLVGQKDIKTKHVSLVKARQNAIQPRLHVLVLASAFRYQWATYNLVRSSSNNQNTALTIDH